MTEPTTSTGAARDEILPFTLLLVLLAVGLVFHLYAAGQGPLQAVFSTLRMLLLEDSASRDDFQQQGAAQWWWLYEVWRLAVPAVASWLLIKSYLHLIGRSGNWVGARLRPHDVLILGDGALARELARQYVLQAAGKRVALLTQSPDAPPLLALRAQGIKVFGGSSCSPGHLRWLGVHRVPVVYVLADSDAQNLAIFDVLMKQLVASAGAVVPAHNCLVHVTDDFLAARIAEAPWQRYGAPPTQVRVVNAWKNCARVLLSDSACSPHGQAQGDPAPHVLMLGFSAVGRCVLEQLARLGHYPDGHKARLTVVSPDAVAVRAQVCASFPALDRSAGGAGWMPETPVIDVDFVAAPTAGLTAQALREQPPIAVAYVCCDTLQEGVDALHSLLMAAPEMTFPIVLCVQQDITPAICDAIETQERCKIFHALRHGLRLEPGEPLLNEFAEREAALVHVYFNGRHPRHAADHGAGADLNSNDKALATLQATLRSPQLSRLPQAWREAAEWERESSRDAVRHLHVKERYFPALRSDSLSAHDRRRLSRLEHQRWCAERLLLGWRHAPQKDARRRQHHNLVPFEALPQADQDKDTDIVDICQQLAKARATTA